MGSLDKSAASSFVYAKASGLLSKSFTGDNANRLFAVRSLRELYTLLFDEDVPSVPEVLLAKEIELKAKEKFIALYKSLLNEFEKPARILSEIISLFEYENSEIFDTQKDMDAIASFWSAVMELSGNDRDNLKQLCLMEISFKNIMWVLRLKVFYHLSDGEILNHLVYSEKGRKKSDIFVKDAVSVLSKDISVYDDWKDWKYGKFLNQHEEGVVWELDPCWIERAFKSYLAKMYMKFFHKDPMSVTSFVSWFKIKQHELDCICSVAEGLRLGVENDEVMEIAGLSRKK